jgi:hypothetical protein
MRDTNSICAFDYDQKLVIERPLPEASRNQEIESWPLPLLYRVRAADLNRDYWTRVSSHQPRKNELRLELYPRRRPADLRAALLVAADVTAGQTSICAYQRLHIILDAKNMTSLGLCVEHGNGSRTSFAFSETRIGSDEFEFGGIVCAFPAVLPPNGWKRITRPSVNQSADRPPADGPDE